MIKRLKGAKMGQRSCCWWPWPVCLLIRARYQPTAHASPYRQAGITQLLNFDAKWNWIFDFLIARWIFVCGREIQVFVLFTVVKATAASLIYVIVIHNTLISSECMVGEDTIYFHFLFSPSHHWTVYSNIDFNTMPLR